MSDRSSFLEGQILKGPDGDVRAILRRKAEAQNSDRVYFWLSFVGEDGHDNGKRLRLVLSDVAIALDKTREYHRKVRSLIEAWLLNPGDVKELVYFSE